MAEYEEETVPSILLPCASCNRTFRPEALAKHVKYCEKTLIKKRKVFDSAKQRIQGTDLAEFLPVLTHKKKVEKSPVRKTPSKWKEKHLELVRAIRAARVGPSTEDLPPAPLKPLDHEKCPHCDRYFGPKAFDRHLEWCKEHSSRIQPKSPASLQAKERLEARTKYRAPALTKSRRTITKEKYQGMSGNKVRDPSPMATTPKSISNRFRDPSPMERLQKSMPSSQVSQKQQSDTSSRLQSHRSSKRNPSPVKKTSVVIKSKTSEFTKSNLSPKGAAHLNNKNANNINSHQDKEDIFNASCNITSIQPLESPKPKMKVAANTILTANNNSSNPNPVLQSRDDMNDSNDSSKQETQQLSSSTGNKFSFDSAYNSLNRKSPQIEDSAMTENEDSSHPIASCGPEVSFSSVASQNSHAARFCHECGAKYPVLAAKFCCHCGVRRLII